MTNRLRPTAIVLSAFMLATCIANAASAQVENTVLSLPADGLQFLPYYVAQDAHLFEQEGLAVKSVMLAGVGTTNGVISGAVDFGISNGASLTRAAARGQKLLAIAIMSDRPSWTIVVRKDIADAVKFDPQAPLAARAQILKGRTFGIDSVNSVGHAFLRVVATAGGLDPESANVTPLPPQDALAVFSRKGIDGFVSTPPWTEKVELDGTAVVFASAIAGDPPWLTPFGSGLVLTRPQFCAEHRSICMKMGHAIVNALAYVHDKPKEADAILKKRFSSIDPAVLDHAFLTIEKITARSAVVVETAVSNSDRLNAEAGFMKPEDQLSSYKELFTDEFVR